MGCSEYFNATTTACGARLNAAIDLGSVMQGAPPVETRTPAHAEVRYKIVYGKTGPSGSVCGNFPSSGCDLTPGWSTSLNFAGLSGQNAIAIRVRLNNTRIGTGPGAVDCPHERLQQHLPVVLHRRRPLDEYPDGPVHLRQPAPALVHGRPHHVGRHPLAAVVTGQPRRRHLHTDVPGRPSCCQRDERHALLLHGDGHAGRTLEGPGRAADRVQHQRHEPAPAPRLRSEHPAGSDRRRGPHGLRPLLRLEPVRHEPALPGPEQHLQPAQPGRTVGRLAAASVHEDATDGLRATSSSDGFMDRFFGVGNTTCPADSCDRLREGAQLLAPRQQPVRRVRPTPGTATEMRRSRRATRSRRTTRAWSTCSSGRTTRSRAPDRGRTRSPGSRASTSPGSAEPTAAASRAASATRARAGTTATCTTATAASRPRTSTTRATRSTSGDTS